MSLDCIKAFLDYDPDTGLFTWIAKPAGRGHPFKIGDIAGTMKDGYVQIQFTGKLYRAHRLAWWWVHGEMPSNDIDHKNRSRADNRICNLRECTRQENLRNSANRKTPTGFKGVYGHPNGRFYATIKIDGNKISLGGFVSAEEAASAYDTAANEGFGEFALLNFPEAK